MNIKNKFDGYYFKHCNNGKSVAFIPGISADGAFIQVITDKRSYNFEFKTALLSKKIVIGKNIFSTDGIEINLPDICGKINYTDITPIKYDIMGPFKFFPMECRHGIISMRHDLSGYLFIGGEKYDFCGGVGYIEKDSGISFPKKYLWLQANDFKESIGIMLSFAEIPFYKGKFNGLISVISLNKKEYRFATYLGAKAEVYSNRITVKQMDLLLVIDIINGGTAHSLLSPVSGKMNGIIRETNNAILRFRFYSKDNLKFDLTSSSCSFERHNL